MVLSVMFSQTISTQGHTKWRGTTSNHQNWNSSKIVSLILSLVAKVCFWSILETPGPGSYMPPSEFGYLDLYKYANNNSPKTS
jgi:hypothetical protein